MIDQITNSIGSLGGALLAIIGIVALHIAGRKKALKDQESVEFYVYKAARVTGHSEYDVFRKSAEDWPVARVSREKIDADFKDYLGRNAIPPYVSHFVRQNKPRIDDLQLPPF